MDGRLRVDLWGIESRSWKSPLEGREGTPAPVFAPSLVWPVGMTLDIPPLVEDSSNRRLGSPSLHRLASLPPEGPSSGASGPQ